MQYTFTSLWIIAVAIALYVSRNWNSTTALFPQAVGFPMLALLVVILVMDIKKRAAPEREGGNRRRMRQEIFLPGTAPWSFIWVGWSGLVLVWAIGLVYSIPIYIFSYMKIQGKYRLAQIGSLCSSRHGLHFPPFSVCLPRGLAEGELIMMFNEMIRPLGCRLKLFRKWPPVQ